MNRFTRYIFLALVSALLVTGTAWAQGSGSIVGTVADPTGAVIPGAEVVATNNATGATRTVNSGADGTFAFRQLPPGNYNVTVTAQSFKTLTTENVPVQVGLAFTLNASLEIGAVAETVTVESDSLSLNLEDASAGNQLDATQVNSLPIRARIPTLLLSLQPGVVFSGESNLEDGVLDSREGAVNGSRGDQTTITLDGVNVNDQQTSNAFSSVLPVTMESVQEFRMITSNPDATAGRSSGAQVQMVTRSGSNDFHGSAYYFHRNDATSSNDFFNNASGLPVPKLRRHVFGGRAGGPIKQDRFFFFANLERRERSEERSALRTVPSADLRQGILTYEVDTGAAGFDPTDPSLFPCPAPATGTCNTLDSTQLTALDPAGLGPSAAILSYLSAYPGGNDPGQGFDNGLNASGFRFNAPFLRIDNIYTAKFDVNLTADGAHTIFARGTLADIVRDLNTPQFPGQGAARAQIDNSKGMVVSYTGQIGPSVTTNLRYGFTRQGLVTTGNAGAEFDIRSFTDQVSFLRGSGRKVPTHEIGTTTSWIRGNHTLTFGGDIRVINNDRFTASNSFARFAINDGFCESLCSDLEFILGADANPSNDVQNSSTFIRAAMAVLGGPITTVDNTFFSDTSGNPLPEGSLQAREFRTNDFEVFFQDSWRIRPNLTFGWGIRWAVDEPIWEKDGLQVAPTIDVTDWWENRVANMLRGVPGYVSPRLEFDLAGKANPGNKKIYSQELTNFSPRLSLAFSPDWDSGAGKALFGGPGKSSIRAGASLIYDRTGGANIVRQDLSGAFGLSTTIGSPIGLVGFGGTPTQTAATFRFSGLDSLPPLNAFNVVPPPFGFPSVLPSDGQNTGFVIDTQLKRPYSIQFNLSIQRETPAGFVVDVGYVGRLGRRLLTKADLAQPLNFHDPVSGQSIWEAYGLISDMIDAGATLDDPTFDINSVPNIPFFENVWSNLVSEIGQNPFSGFDRFCGGINGANTTSSQMVFCFFDQAFFGISMSDLTFRFDVTRPVFFGLSPYPTGLDGGPSRGFVMFQEQFNSLAAFRNWGSSNYHGLQLSARRRVADGFSLDFNYTFSKSIDNGSALENSGRLTGQIPNAFDSKAHRSVSDFDLKHNFNSSWTWEVPFGQGKTFGSGAGGALNQVIGGWIFNGLIRARSGFATGVGTGFNFPTNFFLTGPGSFSSDPGESNVTSDVNGVPNLFSDPDAILNVFRFTRAGEVGSRNIFRTDMFFTLDVGVAKRFTLPVEGHTLTFRWETFNLTNSQFFSDNSLRLDPESPGTFGQFTGISGQPRVMQFSLRYEF